MKRICEEEEEEEEEGEEEDFGDDWDTNWRHKRFKSEETEVSGSEVEEHKPFRLLALPAEIRSEILKLALSQSEPLRTVTIKRGCRVVEDKNYDFAPAILCTCRQLYDEGIEFLYQHNSFDINIFENGLVEGNRTVRLLDIELVRLLGSTYAVLVEPRPSVLCRARRFNIILHICGNSITGARILVNRAELRVVHALCELLADATKPAQTTLSIDVQACIVRKDCGTEIIDRVITPFAFLHGFKNVKITGTDITNKHARQVEQEMMNHQPIVNVWKMFEEMLDWAFNLILWSEAEGNEIKIKAERYLDDGDLKGFLEYREEIRQEMVVRRQERKRELKRELRLILQEDRYVEACFLHRDEIYKLLGIKSRLGSKMN